MGVKTVAVGTASFGGAALAIIAGPCAIESPDLVLRTATKLAALCQARRLPFVFKSSYKKANRSSLGSYTGPGLDEGLAALARVRKEVGVPVLTDVHEAGEASTVAEVVDCLQIPAFLSRQTDLLAACARTGKVVNVKKGQFLAPDDMQQVVEKLEGSGASGILLTERGTTFGHHDLVVDFRGLVVMRDTGWPVVYDATHSLQHPGGGVTGGDRRFAAPLALAAVAAGVDALFFETHPDPARALSDAATQIPLDQVEQLLDQAMRVRDAVAERVSAKA
ncbi:MAG TPA: 3-deoxy-8-phosphooctulonate synthase [Candidatus Eisenbacteria bacterium]|nr:3-deoxy-8-phosphooctulonate synthase [Candidatus Eisenbacteria bacterium]